MSSDSFLTQLQLLARHCSQVILLVVGDVAFPHDEDDLQPLRTQRSERLAMRVPPRTLLVVVRPRPRTRQQREERDLVDYVPQRLIAGEAELDDSLLLAAPLGHGYGAGVGLQVPKRLPPPGGVPETGPERGRGDAVLTDRHLVNPANPAASPFASDVERAAKSIGVQAVPFEARSVKDIEIFFREATRLGAGGAIVSTTEGLFFAQRRLISDLALQNRLPLVWAAPGD